MKMKSQGCRHQEPWGRCGHLKNLAGPPRGTGGDKPDIAQKLGRRGIMQVTGTLDETKDQRLKPCLLREIRKAATIGISHTAQCITAFKAES